MYVTCVLSPLLRYGFNIFSNSIWFWSLFAFRNINSICKHHWILSIPNTS